MRDYRAGKTRVSLLGELCRIQSFQMEGMNASLEHARVSGEEFLKTAAAEEGAEQLPSGIVFRSLAPGEGKTPQPGERAVVRAEGVLPDGVVFLSSEQSKRPIGVEISIVEDRLARYSSVPRDSS